MAGMNKVFFKEIAIGFCLGTANIIPGVSGGTFLLVFNIYERFFKILSNLSQLNRHDLSFILKLLAGAVIAILCLSDLIKYLILNHFSIIYSLFFGLIIISIIIPLKMLTYKKTFLVLFYILGAVATIYLTCTIDPYLKIKRKSDIYEKQYLEQNLVKQAQQEGNKKTFFINSQYSFNDYAYIFLCGAIAVSAMFLPGISGSLVLILMGVYFEVLSAISTLKSFNMDNILFLFIFLSGIIIGGLLFARFINIIFNKYYNQVLAFLTGLMAGSLYALWPFKKVVVMSEQYIKQDGIISVVNNLVVKTNINKLPELGFDLIFPCAAFLAGCCIMLLFVRKK